MKTNFLGFSFFLILLLAVGFSTPSTAQSKKESIVSIVFYNVENLFDTIDDPTIDDNEFTPNGSNQWSSKRYTAKLNRLAEIISKIGDDSIKTGMPVVVGLAEVENKQVVVDLVNTPLLKRQGYKIVHYDSPDKRGIDVALLYQPRAFKVVESQAIPLKVEGKEDFFTRDILLVSGNLKGEPLYVLVNHWPSRSRGQSESAPLRNAAADLCRKSVMNILTANPDANIVIMGDLNDDPTDASLLDHLVTTTDPASVAASGLYNPMWQLFKDGRGTLEYKGKWNLFDQMIVSTGLLDGKPNTYAFLKAGVYKKEWMLEQEGKYKGTPFRTYAGIKYLGGYSDHLPVYMILKKTKSNIAR